MIMMNRVQEKSIFLGQKPREVFMGDQNPLKAAADEFCRRIRETILNNYPGPKETESTSSLLGWRVLGEIKAEDRMMIAIEISINKIKKPSPRERAVCRLIKGVVA
jgi:hypothetical protein